jgi:hypothetical protein
MVSLTSSLKIQRGSGKENEITQKHSVATK